MNIKQLSTTSCETLYDVDGNIVRLWIVTGGEPGMSMGDHSFSKRYPVKDTRWAVGYEEWVRFNRYPHQDPQNIQGPTFDVLPEGVKSLEEYINWALPLWTWRMGRYNQLPVHGELVSPRVHIKENREYVRVITRIDSNWLNSVKQNSPSYYGSLQDKTRALVHPWWIKYADFVNPLIDAGVNTLEKLTDDQFHQMTLLLKAGLLSKAFAKE